MSSSRYWSYQSFENVMEKFVSRIKPDWIKHIRVIPVGYSDWSDTISVIVELDLDDFAVEKILGSNLGISKMELSSRLSDWLRAYVYNYLDTRISITEFRRIANPIF